VNKSERGDKQGVVDLVDCKTSVYLLHGVAGILHRVQRLLVDICGFDAVDFALEGHDLRARLLEGMFKLLLPP
jgi:hypothetical protein